MNAVEEQETVNYYVVVHFPCGLESLIEEKEEHDEYDPNKWNESPQVIPPRDTWMQVMDNGGHGFRARGVGRDSWLDDLDFGCSISRFCPWDD